MKQFCVAVGLVIGLVAAGCASTGPSTSTSTGFSLPFSGPAQFEHLAPTKATDPSQINVPIGQRRADQIARQLGLKKENVLTEQQFLEFISGGGVGGDKKSAALADRSVQIFTNTNGRPLTSDVDGVSTETVLASYGLFVNKKGLLLSLANRIAPTRIANRLLAPDGYINTWFMNNGAEDSLVQLYKSAYTVEALYGNQAQQTSGPWQLVTNTKDGASTQVGMSMAPALWLTNFALLYTLKPEIAAYMPAYWTPIPTAVADAILATKATGFVQYSEYASYFPSPR
ncbi:hypothetical protein [Nitrococcus mobilis]|uniref:hypothetical protein n=1 Tax=Nitrococcus mobilis TaxID=35797 RepID=UPI0003220660|nr:hypothetical protein [Nitrococcus mobilis]